MLAGVSTSIQMLLTELSWKVVSGGPVAIGDSAMAAVTDGDVRDVEQGTSSEEPSTNRIYATQIYFRPTAPVDVIHVVARS
jgi:hypothetical protein